MYKKEAAGVAKLSYLGHVVAEHKHGLIMESCVTQASKRAEWEAGLEMLAKLAPGGRPITVAGDRGYQEEKFIAALRVLGAPDRPHDAREHRRLAPHQVARAAASGVGFSDRGHGAQFSADG